MAAREAGAGLEVPRLSFGTYGRTGPEGIWAVLFALEAGCRHLDTAQSSRKLADHCAARGVLVTCCEPLAHGRVGEEPTLRRIAGAHGATPALVALARELARGVAAIPTSGKRERIAENLAARGLVLMPEEIETLDRGVRSIDPGGRPDRDRGAARTRYGRRGSTSRRSWWSTPKATR